MQKQEARQKLLGRPSTREPFDCGDGVTVFLKLPTVAQRARIMREAGVRGDDVSGLDQAKFQVAVAMELVTDEAGQPFFSAGDREALGEVEVNGWLDKVTKRAQELLTGVNVSQGKPSGETASAS